MKNSLGELKGGFEQIEEESANFEDSTMESIESEEQRRKRLWKSEQSLRQLEPTIKQTTIHIKGVPENI